MQHPNIVMFEVYGDYALFSDPITRVGGEKCSYQVPTYEALKGILMSVYWKPTFIWFIDKVRVLNQIQMEVKSIRPMKYNDSKKNDLSYYTYLKNCRYQVQAHFEWNENRPELVQDRNENKHHEIAKRMVKKGGRRDIFLGTRECQGYVEPCNFGEGLGAYDSISLLDFGAMYEAVTYPDEAYSDETRGKLTKHLWPHVQMKNGIIDFPKPSDDRMVHQILKDYPMKKFGVENGNFSGFSEFEEV